MATRHSKQIPMPQRGPRGSPLTDVLQACPASTIATATVAPEGTTTGLPFTVTVIWLGMHVLLRGSRGKVRFDGNLGICAGDLIGQNARRTKRRGNSQALMSGRQKYGLVSGRAPSRLSCHIPCPGPDQWELVGSSGTKSRPGSHGRQPGQAWHVFLRALQHAHQHGVIHFSVLRTVLPRRTDENLTSTARLHVERYRIAAHGVSALQIAELHQLMPHKSGIAVGDHQVAFPLL